jgi:5-methylcytosine-specific restriction endonuclease McrA
MGKRYRNGWWLAQKYHIEGLMQAEIAEECGVSPRAIRDWVDRRGVETREVVGENHGLYGESRDEDVKERISSALEGREMDARTREKMSEAHEGNEISHEIRNRISTSLSGLTRPKETREKMSESRLGEENPNWRGGKQRNYGPGWTAARRRVRERDEVCQNCGAEADDRKLDVHHIVPVRAFAGAEDAELRDAHEDSNLVLLCRTCHGYAEHDKISFESGIEDPRTE